MEIVNDETTFALAWNTGERVALRDSLCGYERVIFDGAVARAVGGNDATVFIDGGEVSNVNLSKACEHIGQHDSGQVVITRWTDEGTNLVPTDDSWTWVTL